MIQKMIFAAMQIADISPEVSQMPKSRPPYSPEFRRQMVDLVPAGRDPGDPTREFEPTGQSIRAWVAKASQKVGRQSKATTWFARETGTLPSGSSGS